MNEKLKHEIQQDLEDLNCECVKVTMYEGNFDDENKILVFIKCDNADETKFGFFESDGKHYTTIEPSRNTLPLFGNIPKFKKIQQPMRGDIKRVLYNHVKKFLPNGVLYTGSGIGRFPNLYYSPKPNKPI